MCGSRPTEEGLDVAAPHDRGEHDVRAAVADQELQLGLARCALDAEEAVADRARAHPREQRGDVRPIADGDLADLDRGAVAQDRIDRRNLAGRHRVSLGSSSNRMRRGGVSTSSS
jgi:hypothetical protein